MYTKTVRLSSSTMKGTKGVFELVTLKQLNENDTHFFTVTLADVFEHSPWVAEEAATIVHIKQLKKCMNVW